MIQISRKCFSYMMHVKASTALVGGRTLLQQAAEIGDSLLEQISLLLNNG